MDDLSIFVNEWLWEADHLQEGGSQAKATPVLKGRYLKEFQKAMAKQFYGDKAKKVIVARLVVLPQNYGMPQYNQGIIPELLATKEETQTPTLRRMLELSNNGHLKNSYETIDHKLNQRNPRVLARNHQYKNNPAA